MNMFYDKIVNCVNIVENLEQQVKLEIQDLSNSNVGLCFATILIGNDASSEVYVMNKSKKARQLNIENRLYHLDCNVTKSAVIELIQSLNANTEVHGILLQLPIPFVESDMLDIINTIAWFKDIDGLTYHNAGYLLQHNDKLLLKPCTALACLEVLNCLSVTLQSKHVMLLGASLLVGRPLLHMLLKENATVSVAHKYTVNLPALTSCADILIVAVGSCHLVDQSYVKDGAIILDVGINKVYNPDTNQYIIQGDVNTQSVLQKAYCVTPVPHGLGIITIMKLMHNVVKAAKLQLKDIKK